MNIRPPFALIASLTLMVTAWPSGVLAAPAVSGVSGQFVHGTQVTISGSSFGTKPTAKPYLWAPFDGSADPSPLGVVTKWDGIQDMAYFPNEGVGGGGGLKATNGVGTWAAFINSSGFAWNDYNFKWYLFRKQKRNFAFDSGLNWKIIRIWNTGYSSPNFHMSPANGAVEFEGVSGGDSTWIEGTTIEAARGPVNAWFTEEFAWKTNSNSATADGSLEFRVNGNKVFQAPYTTYDGQRKMKARSSDGPSGSMVMMFPVHGVRANTTFPSDYRYWADDVYLDTTWSRVVVGDAPILSQAHNIEVQIPSAWSASSITVTINSRAFPASSSPYLFVVDANGVASPGFPLSQNRPEPPGNLVVN